MMKTMRFTDAAFAEIVRTVGSERAESGGILLGSRADFVVRKYATTQPAPGTRAGTIPTSTSSTKSSPRNAQRGLNFLGFVHSHPAALRASRATGGTASEILATSSGSSTPCQASTRSSCPSRSA
jgi:hypothetical protein